MNFRRSLRFVLSFAVLASAAFAQAHAGAQTLLVLPFDNASKAPGLEWIGEAFPELLGQRMASPGIYVISRDERLLAFDRFGVPQTLHPSLATLYRMAEQMDADYVVIGHYNFDGNAFTAEAQLLDMKALKLHPTISSSGPLTSLMNIQSGLAWDLLGEMQHQPAGTKADFVRASTGIRLDAFENYIRGITAGTRGEKISRLKESIRLNPNYTRAMLQLGKAYFENRDYDQAENWFSRIPKTDPLANEANFELGLAAFYKADYDRAHDAFTFLLTRLPMPSIYNNLGVIAARRNRRSEVDYLQKAVAADPSDGDYRFNLAVALVRTGDSTGAVRQLRDDIQQHPDDAEAKSFLDQLSGAAVANVAHSDSSSTSQRIPMERLKRTYDETSYLQVAMEIENVAEQRLSNADPKTHAAYHLERGRDLLNQGFASQAEKQFREALQYDSANPAIYAGLARALETSDPAAAAREAEASLKLHPSADAYLVLARLALARKDNAAAAQQIDSALQLEPTNSAALTLKRSIESNVSETPKP
ncbi:MAG TPA: tetratricopeptide repeat protein [Candidatus Koribacter sp.]